MNLIKNIMAKHLCDCGKMAEHHYMPASESTENRYYCDDCIHPVDDPGCSCCWRYIESLDISEMPEGVEGVDWRWVPDKEHNVWQYLDEKGRPYLCCEFDSDENGYDIEVQLFLTKEQSESIKDIPQEHGWCRCDVYLKNGTILKEEWITNKEYLWVIEDLNITNRDILKIIKAEN